MTVSKPSLMLGGARIRVQDREIGQVRSAYVERNVTKASHDTNFGLEFRTDHVIAIKTAYTIGWTFEEMQPPNANMMVGSPGYSVVPVDRTLPGGRISPALLAYGQTRRQYTEYVRMLRDRTEATKGSSLLPGIWHGLLYPVATTNTTAPNPVQCSVYNTEYDAAAATTWLAVAVSVCSTISGPASLPSNIEYVPITAVDDELAVTFVLGSGDAIPTTPHYIIWAAVVTRDATTGMFTHGVEFLARATTLTDYHNAFPAANPDGSYSFVFDANLAEADTPQAGDEPPTPITCSYFDDSTQAWIAASWPEDFAYETKRRGGGAVKLSTTSLLDASTTGGTMIKVDYYYDISRIRELPLDASGRNPILPVTMEILFPDLDSKIIWHFFRAQVNTNLRFATSENDWYGQDFTCETLDDSNIHPAFGFGYIQLVGDNIVDEIQKYNNIPYGIDRALADNQTEYA